MTELFIFSQDDELLTILTESTGLTSTFHRYELNQVPEEPFVFTAEADTDKAKHVKEENRVVFKDREGKFREFVIKELDDIDGLDGPETQATCLPAFLDELSENFVLDKRYTNKEAQLAMNDALAGTRYVGEVQGGFGLASTNFFRLSSVDCIWEIRNTWGGDITDEVELDDKGRITKRKMILKLRLGADNGLRFEKDHNIEEIQRTVLSYPKTAMYGYGASLETDGGGNTRYIDFADVEWKKTNGDPVDKPKGQKWVGDPDALLTYGRKHEGTLLPRFGEFYDQGIEDPEELLWATWNHLQSAKKPEVHYRLKADLLDKPASLGDTGVAIDREFARPIEIQSRIIAIEYDLLDIEGTTYVEFGQFLSVNEDNVYRDIEEIKKEINKPRPTKPIDNGSFPDIKPGIPTNVTANGAFETIQLFWDYDSNVYISHYEVYGSQLADFVPDSQHLLWRGRVSAFSHEVNTDETWYYYVRAVNTRGTVGDFSVRVNASTVRIVTDDILFGSITADLLADQLDIADKLAQNTIDRINQAPIEYTDEQIQATESALMEQLNTRIGDVNGDIANLLERTQNVEGTVTNINQEIDTINGTMSTTIEQLNNIDGVVSSHSLTLKALPGQLNAKAEKTEVEKKLDTQIYNNKMTQLDLSISGISGRVSNTESSIDDLTGEITSAKSQIGELSVRADGIVQNVSQIESNLNGRIDSAVGSITTLAGQVSLKASQTSVDTINNQMTLMQSTIDLLPNQINLAVTEGIAGLDIGGRNLLRNSKGDSINGWTPWGTSNVHLQSYNGYTWIRAQKTGGNQVGVHTPVFNMKANKTYRISFDFRSYHNSGYNMDYIYLRQINGSITTVKSLPSVSLRSTESHVDGDIGVTGARVYFDFSYSVDVDNAIVLLALNGNTTDAGFIIKEINISEGIKKDWSPAPEDQVSTNQVIASINLSTEGVRINGKQIHLTGQTRIDEGIIGTVAIANAAIKKAHLQQAIIDDVHINNMSGTKIIAKTIGVDQLSVSTLSGISANLGTVTAGILRSNNNNMDLNLNTGAVRMQNANLTIANGASINFEDPGNTLTYRKYDSADSLTRSAGLGVGDRTGGRYPFAYLGTTGASNLDSLSPYFSGFIANSTAAIGEDTANSVSGWRFQMRSTAVGWVKGIDFDFNSNPTITMIGGSSYNYSIGPLYTIFGKQAFNVRNYANERSGWFIETNYSGNGDAITIRGQYSTEFNYAIGSASHRIDYMFLRNAPNVSSDERLKTDITKLNLGLDFINKVEAKQFRLKLTKGDISQGKAKNNIQYGIIAQQVDSLLADFGVLDNSLINQGDDGYFGAQYEQFIPILINSVQELDQKFSDDIEWLKIENQYLKQKIKQLEEKVA